MQATDNLVPSYSADRRDVVRYTLLAAALVVLVLAYLDTFVSLVQIWMKSDTFAHGILIGPISAYLVYGRRHLLALAEKRANWLACIAIAGMGALWWLASIADVQVLQQLAVVAMIPCLFVAVLGVRAAWIIAFPLGFLLLAVPFGEGMTPQLIDFTADFVVGALRASSIPVYREGTHFVIPSGRWSVVTGCSGMRYLMATITVAALFAYLNYVSNVRRTVFIVGAILVSIVANWLRAYGIVMIAHHSGMRLALGIDHYIYGWVFFGIVIFAIMAVGRIWQQDPPDDAAAERALAARRALGAEEGRARLGAVVGVAALALVMWPLLYAQMMAGGAVAPVPRIETVELPAGWIGSEGSLSEWSPTFHGETELLSAHYSAEDVPVGLFLAWYGAQGQGTEVVNAKNVLIWEKHETWRRQRHGVREIGVDGTVARVIENEMTGPDHRFLVWQWYWTGGRTATAAHVAKLQQVLSQVSGHGSAGASIIVYTPLADGGVDEARAQLRVFVEQVYPELNRSLNAAIER